MPVKFLNPHNVLHGAVGIAKCREARISTRFTEVRHLFGDGDAYAKLAAGFKPACEVEIVTEDVVAAFSIVPGTIASLSFDVLDAEGGLDKTITGVNAVYTGPAGDIAGVKSGPGTATMHFVCRSSNGSTSPISIA